MRHISMTFDILLYMQWASMLWRTMQPILYIQYQLLSITVRRSSGKGSLVQSSKSLTDSSSIPPISHCYCVHAKASFSTSSPQSTRQAISRHIHSPMQRVTGVQTQSDPSVQYQTRSYHHSKYSDTPITGNMPILKHQKSRPWVGQTN